MTVSLPVEVAAIALLIFIGELEQPLAVHQLMRDVIDYGNFSKAAAQCNVSQPTLSVGIAKL